MSPLLHRIVHPSNIHSRTVPPNCVSSHTPASSAKLEGFWGQRSAYPSMPSEAPRVACERMPHRRRDENGAGRVIVAWRFGNTVLPDERACGRGGVFCGGPPVNRHGRFGGSCSVQFGGGMCPPRSPTLEPGTIRRTTDHHEDPSKTLLPIPLMTHRHHHPSPPRCNTHRAVLAEPGVKYLIPAWVHAANED